MKTTSVQAKRDRIKRKVRATVSGTEARPRLSVFRSNNYMYAQLIDDAAGKTVASATDKGAKKGMKKMEGAQFVGRELAKAAQEKKISAVVFDRNGFKYAGRIKALADAAREAGLKF
jgi:large subunit ribosomal protein L18